MSLTEQFCRWSIIEKKVSNSSIPIYIFDLLKTNKYFYQIINPYQLFLFSIDIKKKKEFRRGGSYLILNLKHTTNLNNDLELIILPSKLLIRNHLILIETCTYILVTDHIFNRISSKYWEADIAMKHAVSLM